MPRILVIGSTGLVGAELVPALREIYGRDNVIAGYHSKRPNDDLAQGPVEHVDVTSRESIENAIKKYDVSEIYNLSVIISTVGERDPQLAFKVNLQGHFNILELAREYRLRIFWPSTMAVSGPATPKYNMPQHAVFEPTTIYGVTKYAGELLARYYVYRYDLDIRGVRWPVIVSSEAPPRGGVTDYVLEIFRYAVKGEPYRCYLREDTLLPMMYMPDVIKSVIQLMNADKNRLTLFVGYNVTSFSASPGQLVEELRKYIPGFRVTYEPDFRQKIADTWPKSIDDSIARTEWGWKPDWPFEAMVRDMLIKISKKLNKPLQIK